METPSSTRRVTRSQTIASATSISTLRKIEDSESGLTKSRQRNNNGKQNDRSALIDITNDSPIVGLAMGSLLETPSSSAMLSKKRFSSRAKLQHHDGTPGFGEALLRGQVKNLLQKVEEEAELSKLSLENNRPFLNLQQGFVSSPLTLVAPTPANTPQILNLSANDSSFTQSPVEENLMISQMVSEMFEGKKQEAFNQSQKNLMITRSLLLDFSEKSEEFECSSEVTYQGGESEGKERAITTDDDDSSIWSIQVNASTRDDQEEEENDEEVLDEVEECDNDYFYDDDEGKEKEDDEGLADELCDAISKINVNAEGIWAKFTGKHTRFVYNSDDELEGEKEDSGIKSESASTASPSVLNLKGLPTPKGKHLRFPDD
ncbi:hypothetical protein ACH5RR_013646 [Cinchona calisaya]|uniref:Chalcone-flavanone isomerase family protein n=1 Tax=Cinchona calisaya TaxID=153742 RepID=A0ABD3A207_9GENT